MEGGEGWVPQKGKTVLWYFKVVYKRRSTSGHLGTWGSSQASLTVGPSQSSFPSPAMKHQRILLSLKSTKDCTDLSITEPKSQMSQGWFYKDKPKNRNKLWRYFPPKSLNVGRLHLTLYQHTLLPSPIPGTSNSHSPV